MDSIKSFKGYGKVSEAEDREFRRKSRRRLISIVVALLLLLLIVIGVTIGVVLSNRRRDSSPGDAAASSSSSSPSSSIKAVCSVTRYPDACFSSISSVKGSGAVTDPEELFKLSLRVALDALSKLLRDDGPIAAAFTPPPDHNNNNSDSRLQKALADCKELFADAMDRLNDSLGSLAPAPGEKKLLTASKIDDLKSWLSAAVTDQETCLDGFEGTVGAVRDRMEVAMLNSTRFTSNSLAIVAGIMRILDKLKMPFHRKLMAAGGSGSGAAGMPSWVSGWQRRALLQEAGSQQVVANVTVASDGSGDAKTVKEAVAMVPKKNAYPFVIYIKEGVYAENVVVDKNKWNVHLIGDGMYKTIITGDLNFIDGTPTFSTATVAAVGKRFMARGIGFKNTAGPTKHQAVALRCGSDQSIFYQCSFDAFQDTLYTHSLRQFYRECDVAGTIDFIFGDAAVVFQKCNIRPRQPLANQQNTITAQGRKDPNENTGISIQGCTIAAYDNTLTAPTYLGRPWKNYSMTVIMQSEMGALVHPTGWQAWVPGTVPPDTIYYGEYRNTGPGANVGSRITWPGYKPVITDQEANKYTVGSFINGDKWIPETGVTFGSTL